MKLAYFDLTGKIAIVSGGATGLGYGMSEALAEAGATVVVCSRRLEVCEQSAKELEKKTGGKVVPLRCDVTDKAEVTGLVKQVKNDLGGIDILVMDNMRPCKIRIDYFRAPAEIHVAVDAPVHPDKAGRGNLLAKVVGHRIIPGRIHGAAAAPGGCQ